MKNFILILITIFFVGVLSSCSFVKPLEFKSINSFSVEENSGLSGIVIATNLTLYNPNGFKFKINSADIDVIAEGVNLGKLQIPDQVIIGAKDEFSGDYKIQISLTQLLFAGKKVLSKIKTGNIKIQLSGSLDASFLWMSNKFDIDHSEKINLN